MKWKHGGKEKKYSSNKSRFYTDMVIYQNYIKSSQAWSYYGLDVEATHVCNSNHYETYSNKINFESSYQIQTDPNKFIKF